VKAARAQIVGVFARVDPPEFVHVRVQGHPELESQEVGGEIGRLDLPLGKSRLVVTRTRDESTFTYDVTVKAARQAVVIPNPR
jgi:hypothetical protein